MCELIGLFHAVGESSILECIALSFVACILLLQNLSQSSKANDHAIYMECPLSFWHDGNITELVTEGRAIQQYLPHLQNHHPDTQSARLV